MPTINIKIFNDFGKNKFVADNMRLNETSNDFWDYQEQVFNGLQKIDTCNNNKITEKHLRSVK